MPVQGFFVILSQAREKRLAIQKESIVNERWMWRMKFRQGDAIAGIIITFD